MKSFKNTLALALGGECEKGFDSLRGMVKILDHELYIPMRDQKNEVLWLVKAATRDEV